MARLPVPGSDQGTWGDVLNDFLAQAHNADGTLKDGVISEAKLDAAAQTKLNNVGSVVDADATTKGKIQLAGDLGGTAASPTVPGLASKADTSALTAGLANKVDTTTTVNGHALSGNVTVSKTDVSLGNVDNTSDANKPVSTATQTALNAKAPLASPTFTGTVTVPTPSNNTDAATKLYVDSAVPAGTPDADATTKGKIQLTGDLGGTAASPTVPGLASKADTSALTSGLASKADSSTVSTHTSATTSVHGIADTSALETTTGSQAKVDTHVNDSANAHAASAIGATAGGNLTGASVAAQLAELDAQFQTAAVGPIRIAKATAAASDTTISTTTVTSLAGGGLIASGTATGRKIQAHAHASIQVPSGFVAVYAELWLDGSKVSEVLLHPTAVISAAVQYATFHMIFEPASAPSAGAHSWELKIHQVGSPVSVVVGGALIAPWMAIEEIIE